MQIKTISTLITLLYLTSYCQNISHFTETLIGGYRPLDSTALMNSIVDAAHQYEGNDVPRFAQYDFAFPKDSSEYVALNGNAILLIIGFTHDSTEIPFSRIYLKSLFKELDLTKVLDTKLIYSNDKVLHLFGDHSIVSLYLLPITSLLGQPELGLDWKKNRKAFSFGKLDKPNELGYKILKLSAKSIDENYLRSFLMREFPLIAN